MQEKPHAVTSDVILRRFQSLGRRTRPWKGFVIARYSVSHPVNEKCLEQRSSLSEFLKSHGEGQHLRLPVTRLQVKRPFLLRHLSTAPNYYPLVSFSGHPSFSVSRMRHKDSKKSSFWKIVCEWFSVYFRFPQSDNAEFTSRTLITDRKTFLNLLRKIQFETKSYEYCAGEEQLASQRLKSKQ